MSLDPRPYRRAAGLSAKEAAHLACVAEDTWRNWEKDQAVSARSTSRIRAVLIKALHAQAENITRKLQEL